MWGVHLAEMDAFNILGEMQNYDDYTEKLGGAVRVGWVELSSWRCERSLSPSDRAAGARQSITADLIAGLSRCENANRSFVSVSCCCCCCCGVADWLRGAGDFSAIWRIDHHSKPPANTTHRASVDRACRVRACASVRRNWVSSVASRKRNPRTNSSASDSRRSRHVSATLRNHCIYTKCLNM